MRLQDKVALITGAASGIGRASAILFAREGAKVVVVDIVQEDGEETVGMIKEGRGEAIFVNADVSKGTDADGMIKKAVEKYGRIDILYNNAGIRASGIMLEEMSEEVWDRIININLKGVFLGTKYVVPIMKKQGAGVIINAASTYSFVGRALGTAYCASKGGVLQFTKAAALELGKYNIRVNCVCPGTTVTVKSNSTILYGKSADPEWIKSREKDFPIGRLGRPEDVAYAALYLASDESSFITGSALLVDGGYTTK